MSKLTRDEASRDETFQNNHEWVKYYSNLIGKNSPTSTTVAAAAATAAGQASASTTSKSPFDQVYINEWYQKEERSAQREDFTTPYFDCLLLCKEQEVNHF